MKNIKERIIKKQYVAVIFFLGLMLVMVVRMGKNIKTSEIKSSIEMKTLGLTWMIVRQNLE